MKKILCVVLCLITVPVLFLEGISLVTHGGLKRLTDLLVQTVNELEK